LIGFLARLFFGYKFLKLTDDTQRSREALERLANGEQARKPGLGQIAAENRKQATLAASAETCKRSVQSSRLYDEGYGSPKRIYAKNPLTTSFQWAAGHQMHARFHPKKGVFAVTNTVNMTVDIYKSADFHKRFGMWE
jgi:hypothetical protein